LGLILWFIYRLFNNERMNSDSTIVVADDDSDDIALLKYAFNEAEIRNPLCFVGNGEELLTLLKKAGTGEVTMPCLVLLDLNMPKIGGHEALKQIKENRELRTIPILVFSTSDFEDDIKLVYEMGAASYIVKPPRYADLLKLMKAIKDYWIDSVALPG
jgi:CheY-like chemotaxis protein